MLYYDLLFCQLIVAQVDFAEATLSKMLLKLKGVNADTVVEVVSERVEKRLLLKKILHIINGHFYPSDCEKSYLVLQFFAVIILVFELFK